MKSGILNQAIAIINETQKQMETILLIIIVGLLLIVIFLIIFHRKDAAGDLPLLNNKVSELHMVLTNIDSGLKQDFRINREENANISKENRIELNNSLKDFTLEQMTLHGNPHEDADTTFTAVFRRKETGIHIF